MSTWRKPDNSAGRLISDESFSFVSSNVSIAGSASTGASFFSSPQLLSSSADSSTADRINVFFILLVFYSRYIKFTFFVFRIQRYRLCSGFALCPCKDKRQDDKYCKGR